MRITRFLSYLPKALLFMATGVVLLSVLVLAMTAVSQQSQANRQFQRETGKPCGFCHVPGNEPALNSRGRQFQSCGYSPRCWGNSDGGGHRHRGSCGSGDGITCSSWCDKYSDDPHACKYTWKNSCTRKYGNLTHCIADNPPR
jgi:hypothetical protein